MTFESASPGIVKSIKQRELLNCWLRAYAKHDRLPRFEEYRPEHLAQESDDLVYIVVDHAGDAPGFFIESDGDRMSVAFGAAGRGRDLEEYMGPTLAPMVVPIYRACVSKQLPMFSISETSDLFGRKVDYERLLMPFSDGNGINRIIASLKTISDDGGFEIRNLMRASDVPPIDKVRAVIDRDLFHQAPGRIAPGDTIEFV